MPLALAAFLLIAVPTGATAKAPPLPPMNAAPPTAPTTDGTDSWSASPLMGTELLRSLLQHTGTERHLPPVQQNMQLISKLEMSTPVEYRFDPGTGAPAPNGPAVYPDQIADLAVYKNYAYLNSWSDPTCRRGGIFVVDITNPASPQQVGFLPATPNTRHGEGAHVITVNTPSGPMDVLGVNNEACDLNQAHAGGFDLWNVTNPRNPQPLAIGVGDRFEGDGFEGNEPVHQSHSTFMWNDDQGRAFVAFTDNEETFDLDIYNISDPANPRPVADINILDRFPQVEDNSAWGDWIYNHDMVVKKINGTYTMLVNYWDAGYVTLNVDDPGNPRYIGDTSFDGADPLMPAYTPPEGNAHQGEFSHDNRYILAADEDFDAYRGFSQIGGDDVGFPFGVPVSGTTPVPELQITPEDPFEGDTRFIGDGCNLATIPAPQAGETIAIAERGGVDPTGAACSFDLKSANASEAGYEGLVIFNNVNGAAPRCETALNMTWTRPEADIQTIFVPRVIGFLLMDAYDPATYRCVANDPTSTPTPAPNRAGLTIRIALEYDGWGYTHLYENTAGKMRHVDAFAIQEGLDERYARGFGDLSVHEFAADPTENVAYSSYYAAGMRVSTFGPDGLRETGKFIDEGGNNFWGVEQFTSGGERYIAGSDRDFGLYILKYTGPGAPARPSCADQNVTVPYQTAVTLTLTCTDANGNGLTRAVASNPSNGTLSAVDQNARTVTYTPKPRYSGADQFTFTANDGAASSAAATVRITVGAGPTGCANTIAGTRARDLIQGTPASDRVNAAGGNDVVDGRAGSDCLFGQTGGDRINGEGGSDQLSGGAAGDGLSGGTGADRLSGAAGNDRLGGSAGNDRLSGGAGRDRLNGGRRNDRLIGGNGNDRLTGGAGNDRVTGGDGRDRIATGSGADRIDVRDGNVDRVNCGKGRDRVTRDRSDRLTGCERVSRRR